MENQDSQTITPPIQPKQQFPTEIIELPSQGLVYPKENPLSSGKIEMRYMTAKDEDILTNENFIKQGIVIDKLLQSLIVSKINYEDLILGDKNAVLVASRILGYGAEYTFKYKGESITVNLSELAEKTLDKTIFKPGLNEFEYTTPVAKNVITFKILNGHDEKIIEDELKGLKRLNKNASTELTTRLKQMILTVNGDTNKANINNFIQNQFLAKDSKAFRDHVKEISPDIDMTFTFDNDGLEEKAKIPVTVEFFWPGSEL